LGLEFRLVPGAGHSHYDADIPHELIHPGHRRVFSPRALLLGAISLHGESASLAHTFLVFDVFSFSSSSS